MKDKRFFDSGLDFRVVIVEVKIRVEEAVLFILLLLVF